MLPNKLVAVALAALLAGGLFAGVATAQITGTPDLIIEGIQVGSFAHPRISEVEQRLNITIRNQGNGDWSGATGWQIFVGYNGRGMNDCITGNSPAVTQLSPCFIRMTPGATGQPLSIPRGEARTYWLNWNASREQANETGSAFIWVEILPAGTEPTGDPAAGCTGPDTGRCENNGLQFNGIFVGRLGVRSVPQRGISDTTDATENTPWQRDEIKDPCPVSPDIVQRGCKAKPDTTIVASFLVTNVGSVEDSYTPSVHLQGDDPNYFKKMGYTFHFAPHNFSLGPKQKREVLVYIYVPKNETAGFDINVDTENATFRWASTRAAHISTAYRQNPGCVEFEVYCRDPTLPSLLVDFRREFNVTVTNQNLTWAEVEPGTARTFNILVNNTGNAEDDFNVSFDNDSMSINESWIRNITGPTVVQPGQIGNYTVQVRAPTHALNQTYYFDVTIKSHRDLAGDAPCKAVEVRGDISHEVRGEGVCRVRFYMHVKQQWLISGVNDAAYRVVPGTTITYNLAMKNSGNGHDNVSLELQTTVFGWDVRLSNQTLHLPPNRVVPFTLTVTSPPNIPENTEAAFYVNATASGPIDVPFSSRSKAVTESRMTIIRGPNIRISAPVNTSFIDAGSEVDYTLLVSNVGNVADNFTIPTPERPADWGVSVEPTHLDLLPNQQGTVKVSLRAPANAEVGEKATALVTVKSSVDRTRQAQFTLEGRVSGPDLFVDNVLVDSASPYSGDQLNVTVALGNSGNKGHDKNATLRVYFVRDGVEHNIGERVYPAFFIPGQRRLTETFAWDTTGIDGSGVLLARIDVGDNVKEIDDSAASNERTRALTLRTFSIHLTPAQGLEARPGEKVTYSEAPNVFLAEYRGNQPSEPVTIRFESEHGWLSSQPELTIALPRGTPVPIIATLDVPALPGTAEDTLTLTLTPSLRPEEVLRASTKTVVIDEEKPLVKAILVTPASGKLGEPVTIEAHVEDATGVSAVLAYVTLPTNETSAVPLEKITPERWSANKTFTIAGRYRVTAEATDSASPPNRNTTRDTAGLFELTPGSAPTIKLAAGQATTIRTGSPVKLDIRDPLGIGKASYSIKGVSYDLKGPAYQIDTSTFLPGNVEVTITAENIYGVATRQTFTFTVDNAPPTITRVTMTPERPRANEDVKLVIATEAKVEMVDILVKRDGQVVQSINATKRGIGTFEATFNPGEGDYRIDVTARDAAGNTKLADGAVVFSAKPGSPFDVPAPGLWALLVGLAAVALALRRR